MHGYSIKEYRDYDINTSVLAETKFSVNSFFINFIFLGFVIPKYSNSFMDVLMIVSSVKYIKTAVPD
ncbi:MAG: hypothetical protein AYK18_00095 [Theionarchaea archaeon DG-70]|nr:MAG: hypothetical protein AYK18_00095 [Theionarchaea archaeon DG-70]